MGSSRSRPTSLTSSFDFTSDLFACYDYWSGGASGGLIEDLLGGNRARIRAVCAVPSEYATPVEEGTEAYSFKININNSKTVGLGACAGCTDQACIVLSQIKIDQLAGSGYPDILLTNPAVS